ncbi:MAG TPA: penicillin acylase family protein [Myxococcota bacterium]|nr:penicillin acylase family protein [Myxococcota bacterium]
MRKLLVRVAAVLAVSALALLAWAFWPVAPDFDPAPLIAAAKHYDARIARDPFGVPHVRGRRDADVAYGLAWAHCEDDFRTIQEVALATRGKLASVSGPGAAPLDYLAQLLGVYEDVARRYEREVPLDVRALAEGYAAGVNHYAARHASDALPGLFPLTGVDVVAGFAFKTPFFYGLDRTFSALFADDPPKPPLRAALSLLTGPHEIGSNAIAVAPRRSADGATRLLVNSHQPYTGPVAWYEVRLQSDEGWEMTGGVFPGSPVVLHGAGPTLGWANTVNLPDLADVYRLEIDPENPDRYRLDGAWRELERGEAVISVKMLGRLHITRRMETLRSEHGPVLRRPHGTYAIRNAGMGELRQLEQLYRQNRARTFDEWLAAMRIFASPSINYVYADRAGNIAYLYNARIPKRAPGFDWRGILPGDRSDLIWREMLPFDALPRAINPSSGFVVNMNHTPFAATSGPDNPRAEDFPPEAGIETYYTNRGRRGIELFGADESISAEEFRAYKFDKRYSEQSEARKIVDELLERVAPGDPELGAAREVLARWQLTTEADDPSAALAVATALPIVLAQRRGEPPPDALAALRDAAQALRRHHGRLDPPWAEVNRIRRGALDLGVGGGPDVLRAVETDRLGDDGRFESQTGDTLILFSTWDASGAQTIETIHQFGSATLDASSPHYADQLPLFAREETKRVPLSEAELLAGGATTYHPGEPRP